MLKATFFIYLDVWNINSLKVPIVQITTKYLVITGSKNNTVRRMYIPMSHFLTEHTSFRSLGRSEVSYRTRILRRSGARRKQARAASKLRAWSRHGKIGRGRLSRSYAAATTKKSSQPCAFVRSSSLHAACRTSWQGSRAAPVIRPGRRRRRNTVHPPAPEILYWKV